MHDVNDELSNLERQRESTQRIVGEIERQIGGLASQLDRSSAELILAEDNLAERRAVLERRLVDIYKRGPLYTFQALLAAESFGDLLSRYKYLYLTSRQDRALVTDVEQLRNRVVSERNNILDVRGQLDRPRQEREAEFAKYTELARARAPAAARSSARPGSTERRLTDAAEGRGAAQRPARRAGAGPARRGRPRRASRAARARRVDHHRDLGKLDWPVEGTIVYRFGRDTLPSGGIIRWNGVGIAARGGDAGQRGRGGQGAAGGTVRDLRAHDRAGARQRLLLGLLPPRVRRRQAGGDGRQGRRRSGRWAARTRTTGRTCISRSGARIRWRSIRRRGCGRR